MSLARKLLSVAGGIFLCAHPARAAVLLTNLVNFNVADGGHCTSGLVQATNGSFYGTTYIGGSGNPGSGTVFRISATGVYSNLVSFTNGANPYGGLVQGTNGNFYGTTESGGTNGGFGTVFQMTPSGTLTTLLSFNNTNGAFPEATLVTGADGNFYGTTAQGGTNGGFGTIFRISQTGSNFKSLVSFNNTNGSSPYGALVQTTNGNFYGTALLGGTKGGFGTVFQMTSAGALSALYSFDNTNGGNPYAGLTPDAKGNFYGTASAGGTSNNGVIFMITPGGSYSNLFTFNGSNGASPYGPLLLGVDGGFYGTTQLGGSNSYGTVFRWSPAGGFSSLLSFDYFTTGALPLDGLTQGTDGNFYGTTHIGVLADGTVFRLSAPVSPVFKSAVFSTGNMVLSWTAVAGQSYQLQSCSNLSQTNWVNLGPSVPATNGMMSVSNAVSAPQRFYRVMLGP